MKTFTQVRAAERCVGSIYYAPVFPVYFAGYAETGVLYGVFVFACGLESQFRQSGGKIFTRHGTVHTAFGLTNYAVFVVDKCGGKVGSAHVHSDIHSDHCPSTWLKSFSVKVAAAL